MLYFSLNYVFSAASNPNHVLCLRDSQKGEQQGSGPESSHQRRVHKQCQSRGHGREQALLQEHLITRQSVLKCQDGLLGLHQLYLDGV